MADALVSIVLEKLGSIVLDGIEEEVRLIVGVKKEIKSLTDTLTIIQGVLEDAEEKQVKNKAVKFWLQEFKDISYDADDILDEWSTRFLIRNVQHPDLNASVIKKVRSHLFSLFSCFKPIVIRHDIGNKIRELNERLVGVVEKKQLFDLREIRSNNEQHRPITSDLVVVEEIYGRDVDKDLILAKLLDESAHHDSHVPVISIVGTGGFGKTTLAQLILEHTKQLSNFKFDKHMWVC
ncbi:Disease resistance protein rga2, partial [Thalictrum thalictroides]